MKSTRRDVSVFLVLLAGFALADPGASRPAEKPASISTVGPAVPLSASQRSALAAKRAVTIAPAPRSGSPAAKAAPIATVPGGAPTMGFKKAPPGGAHIAPATAAARASRRPASARPAGDEAVIRGLGLDAARRAGLVKGGGSR